jgi:hypothetical protein
MVSMLHSSGVMVSMLDSSGVMVSMLHSSGVLVSMLDSSGVMVSMLDSSGVMVSMLHSSGVMVSMLDSSAVDRGFEPRSGQPKDYKIGICCFSAKQAALKRKSKDWLARNQNNVSKWSDMSTH